MGWWVPVPLRAQKEGVLWTFGAARREAEHRYPGGRMFVTPHRLIFQPSRLSALSRAQRWSAKLTEIQQVEVEPRNALAFGAARRNRLKLIQRNGGTDIFMVNGLTPLIARLEQSIRDTEASDPDTSS